jgi:hypothetical protein
MNFKKTVSSRNQESMVSHIVKKPHVGTWGSVKKPLVDLIRTVMTNYLLFWILL